jgi:hypothetical protein
MIDPDEANEAYRAAHAIAGFKLPNCWPSSYKTFPTFSRTPPSDVPALGARALRMGPRWPLDAPSSVRGHGKAGGEARGG